MRRVLLLPLAFLFALDGCAYRGGSSGGGGYGDDDDATDVESGPMDAVITITNDTGEDLTYFEQFVWGVGTDIEDGSIAVLDLTLGAGETFTETSSFNDDDYLYGVEFNWVIFAAEETWTRCYAAGDIFVTGPSPVVSIWLDLEDVAECPE